MHRATAAASIALLLTALTAPAGPIDPPSGPVAPSMKTLAQLEPRVAIGPETTPAFPFGAPSVYTITQPGSYYLTGNVTGESGKIGIRIGASNVTIDLNGFTLQGVPGSSDAIATDDFSLRNITIRNGVIRGWGGNGISPESFVIEGWRIENITAEDNAGTGISVPRQGIARGCTSRGNGGAGFVAGMGSVVEGCTASNNGAHGFSGVGATITTCSAFGNAMAGFSVGTGGQIAGCTAAGNVGDGILVASEVLVTGNSCRGNGNGAAEGAGIRITGSDNRIEGNNVLDNDRGVRVEAAGNFIVRNSASGNTLGNYTITGVQTIGPIITAAGTITSTNPWANFEF